MRYKESQTRPEPTEDIVFTVFPFRFTVPPVQQKTSEEGGSKISSSGSIV